ncbi:hypothetical protein [Bacillus sp. FJAT-29937]|uniref:hypothetical protein n=1 Tax=Bacillus sp. FJAT-29937 TaxID=1720553 RepID=UPI000833BDCC|nr:hypothetical protein [Bacillus sp. FJAT-29937]
MIFNPFFTDPQFNPSKHIRPIRKNKKPWELLEQVKIYEIEIEGEGKGIFEVRGFWHDDRVGINYVILWPEGATRAEDYVNTEIVSVREISKNTAG